MPAAVTSPQPSTARTASANAERAHLLRIARRMSDPDFGTGALASLRRGDPATVLRQPSFHRLVRAVDDVALGGDGALRWATAVHVFAVLARPGSRWPSRDVGTALAEASLPESRLSRLFASRGDAFRDQAALVSRFLHARDAACTPTDLGELALVEDRAESRAERLRFRIARSYYRIIDAPPATVAPA